MKRISEAVKELVNENLANLISGVCAGNIQDMYLDCMKKYF